jgi:hypothetical protein
MLQHLAGFACALMVLGCATDSLLWQRFTEKDFPARVDSVMTRFGDSLDTEHTLTYGPWKVGFGKDKPNAFYNCPQDSICYIVISNLRCDHFTSGSAPCELKLYDDATCKLVIPKRLESFRIGCPLDVSLEPKSKGDKDKANTTRPPKQGAADSSARGRLPSTV